MEPRHRHDVAWQMRHQGLWKFCACEQVYLQDAWRTLDNAWQVSNGGFRKLVQAVVDGPNIAPLPIERIIVQWARRSHKQQFHDGLEGYYLGKYLDTVAISIETIDDTITPLTKESAVNFLIHAVRVQNGWVGQIIDESLNGEILFETVPQEDQVNDDHEVTITGLELAKRMASDKLTEVKRTLFR
jgi:hypothetical protein